MIADNPVACARFCCCQTPTRRRFLAAERLRSGYAIKYIIDASDDDNEEHPYPSLNQGMDRMARITGPTIGIDLMRSHNESAFYPLCFFWSTIVMNANSADAIREEKVRGPRFLRRRHPQRLLHSLELPSPTTVLPRWWMRQPRFRQCTHPQTTRHFRLLANHGLALR
ncbi:uncharacterized protein LAESUDRAFT_721149 [Laetiporus sulphureus 93-53]|uniref:Uncharacterized protein n=1 Tax=Laetiporus sulphureus 93-53 TaxID=1314785 RepID=A0A165GT14_9APHY|nr:uncharacterized protein LAESUDRAFT_721149 [Laetiporus sulphureus 93-53]KZT10772.1 hypothetical protein LAESUDRAFT_721149 [Laetiporus sulphureus 93-53]